MENSKTTSQELTSDLVQIKSGKKSSDLKVTPAGEQVLTDPYIIALMNLSSKWTCIQISFDKVNWYATPLVGRTCPYQCSDADLQKCFKEGKYSPIATINCGAQTNVYLKFKDSQGNIGTLTDPYYFFADCKYKGKVLVFCD